MKTNSLIGKIKLSSYILNASGPQSIHLNELQAIGRSHSGAILIKSCTLEPREGNAQPAWADLPFGGLNSMGLPNLGYKAYLEMVPQLKALGKPVIAALSGLCQADNEKMLQAFNKTDVDLIELNISCPNVRGKSIVGYDFQQMDELLGVSRRCTNKPLGIKLPPYFDQAHHREAAQLLKKHHIDFISCINTVGNALAIDPEKETALIKPQKGLGGLSGSYIKPIALANVRIFYELMEDSIPIFGVGGVSSGMDAFEFLLAGASAVQVATIFAKEGLGCFERIEKELGEILERKGYRSIEEARGQLKFL